MRLLLARHGQSRANVEGVLQGRSPGELTALGRAQAAALAAALAGTDVVRIVSSDLRRAVDTARPIAESVGIALEHDTILQEWHVGEFDGAFASDLERAVRASALPPDEFRPTGGESRRDLHARVARIASTLVHDVVRSGTGLLVSHGDVLRALVSQLLVGDARLAARIELANASLTTLIRRGSSWDLARLNDTSHLDALDPQAVGPTASEQEVRG